VAFTRYPHLLSIQLRTSLSLAMQYRADFLIDGVISVFWTITALVPIFVIYSDRPTVAGWSFGAALLVVGWFTALQGVLEGAINPSLATVVEQIRQGTLDFTLLKPADAQFLVSTARFQPWRMTSAVTALAIFAVGFHKLGTLPSIISVLSALLLFANAIVLLYSMWIVTVSAAFYVVRVDNLSYLFGAIFDAARWPASIFRGTTRFVFTFVIPLTLMTTYPAEALLGRMQPDTLLAALAGGALASWLSRRLWLNSIGRYTSAGG
jgi:ABC-2 type transport system permease protein